LSRVRVTAAANDIPRRAHHSHHKLKSGHSLEQISLYNFAQHSIAERKCPSRNDLCREPTVTAQGVVCARTESGLHARTRFTRAGYLDDDGRADPQSNRLILEESTTRSDVQPRDHQVATKRRRIDRRKPQEGRHGRDVLSLQQRNLTLATCDIGNGSVAAQAASGNRLASIDVNDRFVPPRPQVNSDQRSGVGESPCQRAKIRWCPPGLGRSCGQLHKTSGIPAILSKNYIAILVANYASRIASVLLSKGFSPMHCS
jgi:hypothetical protein